MSTKKYSGTIVVLTEQVYTITDLELTGAPSKDKILRALNKDKFGDITNCERTQDSEVLSWQLDEKEALS